MEFFDMKPVIQYKDIGSVRVGNAVAVKLLDNDIVQTSKVLKVHKEAIAGKPEFETENSYYRFVGATK